MKHVRFAIVVFFAMWTIQIKAGPGGVYGFLQSVASADVVGMGVLGDSSGDFATRIDNATFWLSNPETNSVLLTIEALDDPFYLESPGTVGDTVVFWGMRQGWNPLPSNVVFRATPVSAWEYREKLMQAGSAEQIPSPPFQFPGTWINVTTSSLATVNFISNIIHSLCVSPNLNQYSDALIPPLEVDWENELSMFKADAHMELLALEGGGNEDFLEHVLNSPQYPRRFRGHALFQLKKRFDWPATNTVPEP